MEGLYRVLVPIEGNDIEHIRNPRWFDLSPHATMVHDTLMNSAGGHFNIELAEAIMDEHNTRMEETPSEGFKFDQSFQDIRRSEPMKIALQLLKERKSPEAFAHKLEYDKKYQKNPKRVKYRVQLNRERRKRGIYGKGGKDVSHTQGNKLTLENPHSNRARHFKNRGTLRRVKVR